MGTGQFRPGDAAKPHIGAVGRLEEVPEAMVETICVGEDVVKAVVKALKRSVKHGKPDPYISWLVTIIFSVHPYETPSYQVYKLENF